MILSDIYRGLGEVPRGSITDSELAALLGVDKIVVPRGVVNTAAEGATEATSFIFGKSALLVYAESAPSILKPTGGYTFVWTGLLGAVGREGGRMKKFRMEELESDRFEGAMAFDQKVVATELGVYFSAAIA